MDDQGASLGTRQILLLERVGGRDDLAGAVRADIQWCEVTARRVLGATTDLQMTACGVEVAGRTAGRGDGVGLALSHRVNVHSMAARGQDPGRDGLHRHRRVSVREVDRRIGDGPAVWRFSSALMACSPAAAEVEELVVSLLVWLESQPAKTATGAASSAATAVARFNIEPEYPERRVCIGVGGTSRYST